MSQNADVSIDNYVVLLYMWGLDKGQLTQNKGANLLLTSGGHPAIFGYITLSVQV